MFLLVRSRPLQEAIALRHIRREGGSAYCPVYWDERRKRRQPLFATYLFCKKSFRGFGWLNTLPGVLNVVHFGEQPALVPDSLVESLQARENANGNIVLVAKDQLAPGDRVKLLSGPFAGHIGIYQGMTTNERISVLLNVLSSLVPAFMQREAVERLSA